MQIAILGHQPQISLAEIESVYPSVQIKLISDNIAVLDAEIDLNILGGVIKTSDLVMEAESLDNAFRSIADYYSRNIPLSKINLGFSVYSHKNLSGLNKKMYELKKSVKDLGVSSRIVNQKNDTILNSAQIKYNKLLTDKGFEWILVGAKNKVFIGQTNKVQDVDQFSARDFERPYRDAQNGMLPPKFALCLVNIASQGRKNGTLLDPFCGSGVVLQEALLRGFDVIGSDLNPEMSHASEYNLKWLKNRFEFDGSYSIKPADATMSKWDNFDFVACETYLGPPLTTYASDAFFASHIKELDYLHSQFLKNIHNQTKPKTRLAVAMPAWIMPDKSIKRLPLVDRIEELGYNHVDFDSIKRPLIYSRNGQYVARDVVVIERK